MPETTLLNALAAHVDEMDGDWTPLRWIAGWLEWGTCEQVAYLDVLQTMLECAPWYVTCASAHGGPVADSGELRTRTLQLWRRAPELPAASGGVQ
ncbi:hypothetical protein GCM10027174_26790 [Salinifilum aidingensis]